MTMALPLPSTGANPVVQIDKILAKFRIWTAEGAKPVCKEVVLAHHVEGGTEVLATHPWIEKRATEKFEQELLRTAHEFEDTALAHASTFDRLQRYRVAAFKEGGVCINTHEFVIAPHPATAMVGGETEPANSFGVLSQLMRHNEAFGATLMSSQHEIFKMMHEEIDRLRKENAELRRHATEHMRATEDLINRKWERDLKLRIAEEKTGFEKAAWGYVEQLVPPLLEKVTGNKAVAGAASPLIQFLSNLRPEQRDQIVNVLDQDQYAQLEGLMADIKKDGGA